jgi:response regulator RpfG family c-di-GMP phosphodiesterase/serine/threonine protein kinase
MGITSADTQLSEPVPPLAGRGGPAHPTTAEQPDDSRERSRSYVPPGLESDLFQTAAPGSAASLPLTEFVSRLLESSLLTVPEIEEFLADHPGFQENDTVAVVEAMVGQGLLTAYQVSRLVAGHTFGLVLGNYRIVERIGAGGMGVVYKAEHIHMKRAVAIKVLVTHAQRSSVFLQRFYSEMQATAVLSHPNIVLAFDAGEMPVPHSQREVLRYLVMEYVPGKNLEQYVLENGPLPITQACDYIRQAASGLQHAYEHGLIHRDIKPSNLLLTPLNQVKILDFGLARLCRRRHTEAHAMLGSVDYMAPEQARDARSVDIRADIYGLGGTLYWLLVGRQPFPGDRPVIEELLARQRESPLPPHKARPEVPLELETVIYRMMALDPNNRYPTPAAVMTALSSFLESATGGSRPFRGAAHCNGTASSAPGPSAGPAGEFLAVNRSPRVLVVSEAARCRASCRSALQTQGLECLEARQIDEVNERLNQLPCDLLLVDAQLPDGSGLQLCSRLRAEPPVSYLKLVLLTPENTPEWIAASQRLAVDDFFPKTLHAPELAARVRSLLRTKEAEERADLLSGHLRQANLQLEQTLKTRDVDLYQAQDVLIFAMAKMAELRGLETGSHLQRLQGYVRVLAEEAMTLPAFAGRIDDGYVRMLERCVLLHDVGKVAIPDHILLKPGLFTAEERCIMESHTAVGADMLAAVARQHGASLAFLQMATDICRHHHERYDGSGYPDGLAGEAIPLGSRIVAIADVYDALRSKLVYKPGLTHVAAKRLILEANAHHFDPALLVAFRHCEANFEQIFTQTRD